MLPRSSASDSARGSSRTRASSSSLGTVSIICGGKLEAAGASRKRQAAVCALSRSGQFERGKSFPDHFRALERREAVFCSSLCPIRLQAFHAPGLAFLSELAENNDKDWFEAHRAAWDEQLLPAMIALCAELQSRLADVLPRLEFVPRVGGSLYRLNRDIRFSRDKRPYETHAAALLWEGADKQSSPGVYVQISPAEVTLGGGLHVFEEAQLERYRKRVMSEGIGEALSAALASAKKKGLKADGEKIAKPPRGVPADHPRMELSKHKGLVVMQTLKGGDWLEGPELLDKAEAAARAYAPLHDWLRTHLCV